MGYCSYNGQRVPGNKQNCTKPGTTWIEEDVKDEGFQGNFLIGKDFGTAVMNTLNPDSPETEEDLKGYLTRRAEDDPYGLAIDAGLSVAGGGVGIDNLAFLSWFNAAGGKELYEQLWDEMDRDIKGFMLQPVGPEALGWFKEPINSMEDFRKYRFRTPPGIPGQTYKDIGIASVAMGGGDILPALEAGTIDAAEWCCPKPDSVFGFQKVLKHYYLQGLHQVVVNADFYINGSLYDGLTDHEKNSLQAAADASLMLSLSDRIYENGKALKMVTEEAGVILHDTPTDYFSEYMAAALATLNKNAEENEFFNEVYTSMKEFADIAVPFWSGAQMSNAKLGMAHAATLK